MLHKTLFALSCTLLLFTACQTEEKSESQARKTAKQQAVQKTEHFKNILDADSSLLITGADSVLISKKHPKEDYDKAYSAIYYMFYNESAARKRLIEPLKPWQLAINNEIRKSLYQPDQEKPYPGQLTRELIRKSLAAFKKEANRYNDDLDMVWSMYDKITISDGFASFASLKSESSMYQGGAHGSFGIGISHFDKASGKKLKITDFFRTEKDLLSLAEKSFRKSVGLSMNTPFEKTDYWFENGFYLPDNFECSKKEITFYFNAYEVSNYANGTLSFSLSLKEIKPFLLREMK
ncbi:MAG: hypothetical protein RLZZ65_865 [Bacteroidota bacterium]|jgi:hypothetical protein